MVAHKDKRRAAGWKYDKPHTEEERKELLKKHGKDCFLRPEELKYPICNKEGEPDCRGIIAAKFWADVAETKAKKAKKAKKTRKKRPYSFKKVSSKAKRMGKKLGCVAFKGGNKKKD